MATTEAEASVDDYIRKLVACARALPQKTWEWRQFLRPGGEPIETVEHVCEAQDHSARQSDVAELWGVNYGPDTPVVCFTGNGPCSAKHAQYFAALHPGALLWILDELGARIERLQKAPDHVESHEVLGDIVSLESERQVLTGGGPGWKTRWDATMQRACEIFED